jgi:hypothetical protein
LRRASTTIAGVLAASGCFDAPTGAPQTWPPPLRVRVEAVTAGDLDRDGTPEVVVYASGTSEQAGMYLLRGGTDLVLGTQRPVRSFSTFLPLELTTPVGALQTGGLPPRVYALYNGDPLVYLGATDAALSPIDTERVTGLSVGGMLWVRAVAFPGGATRIALSNGAEILHATPELTDLVEIPPPQGDAWPLAQTITSYADGNARVIVVATPERIVRATIPSAGGGYAWSEVRAGAPWVGQTAFDLDGDGRDEILGFDPSTRSLCVVDVVAGPAPCFDLGTSFSGTTVTISAGHGLTASPGPDLVVVQAGPSDTRVTLVEDYSFTPTELVAMAKHELAILAPPHGMPVVVRAGIGQPDVLLLFDREGGVTCAHGPC